MDMSLKFNSSWKYPTAQNTSVVILTSENSTIRYCLLLTGSIFKSYLTMNPEFDLNSPMKVLIASINLSTGNKVNSISVIRRILAMWLEKGSISTVSNKIDVDAKSPLDTNPSNLEMSSFLFSPGRGKKPEILAFSEVTLANPAGLISHFESSLESLSSGVMLVRSTPLKSSWSLLLLPPSRDELDLESLGLYSLLL
ncbi:hypothetical protein WICPIJ_008886 [Wickerhamomyces pijperi]|uniref:Uncharacterized protein n=1 Tax=Wickerhamomyces pijperi TaxID=599730 RepID=A0A9P8PTZ8_WICPI|nr:hypothetical protein WICPIJ_008886 [Wickerhamomyces pijperi]